MKDTVKTEVTIGGLKRSAEFSTDEFTTESGQETIVTFLWVDNDSELSALSDNEIEWATATINDEIIYIKKFGHGGSFKKSYTDFRSADQWGYYCMKVNK